MLEGIESPPLERHRGIDLNYLARTCSVQVRVDPGEERRGPKRRHADLVRRNAQWHPTDVLAHVAVRFSKHKMVLRDRWPRLASRMGSQSLNEANWPPQGGIDSALVTVIDCLNYSLIVPANRHFIEIRGRTIPRDECTSRPLRLSSEVHSQRLHLSGRTFIVQT
jgi:hypothetical protein